MRISDWSSDVCSSDLLGCDRIAGKGFGGRGAALIELAEDGDKFGAAIGVRKGARLAPRARPAIEDMRADLFDLGQLPRTARQHRSAERRVGQECVSTGRSRWSPAHYKNTHNTN